MYKRQDGEWVRIIEVTKTPLAFFVLTVLAVEALLGVLVAGADKTSRTIAIVGMLVLLAGVVAAVAVRYLRKDDGVDVSTGEPEALRFESIIAEVSSPVDRLEEDDYRLARYYFERNDGQRLLDGLYSAALYASSAVPTGYVDPTYYGNLMEWDATRAALRVRYFHGPYNDEIITRAFPLDGPGQGVASAAVVSGKIQCRNKMDTELKERGEARLKAMMSIPVASDPNCEREEGAILVLNIDSVKEAIFPSDGSEQRSRVDRRASDVANLIQRVNRMQRLLCRSRGS